jgi:hypothetical protein
MLILIRLRSASATLNAKSFTACSSDPAVIPLQTANLDFLRKK